MRVVMLAVLMLHVLWTGGALACTMAQPKGEVVLTVDGVISECNSGLEVRFDMAMLEALPKTTVKTGNPWEQGVVTFEGVLLRDLLAHVKAQGESLEVGALNDYHADIPIADVMTYDVVLAYKREGSYMSVREKGPLFVVFPFTDVPALAGELRFAQSVWQVNRITVK